jgi:hypothetical protein
MAELLRPIRRTRYIWLSFGRIASRRLCLRRFLLGTFRIGGGNDHRLNTTPHFQIYHEKSQNHVTIW